MILIPCLRVSLGLPLAFAWGRWYVVHLFCKWSSCWRLLPKGYQEIFFTLFGCILNSAMFLVSFRFCCDLTLDEMLDCSAECAWVCMQDFWVATQQWVTNPYDLVYSWQRSLNRWQRSLNSGHKLLYSCRASDWCIFFVQLHWSANDYYKCANIWPV